MECTDWQIRADSIRTLNLAEKEPEGIASGSGNGPPSDLLGYSDDALSRDYLRTR